MEAIKTLSDNIGKLSASDAAFARSLLDSRTLSEKQHYWIGVLAERATTPRPAARSVGDFSGVIDLFTKAREHLKHPKIRMQLPNGTPVVLSVAGSGSKAPGTVNVTDGGPYGANRWFGRVTPKGEFQPSLQAVTGVEKLLSDLASKPAETAAAYGRLTGNCCFCDRTLKDERSTDVGYGPICAKRFGLAWGR